MRSFRSVAVLLAAASLAACHDHHPRRSVSSPLPRSASLDIEIYDPLTDFVWEGVSVRIVEGAMEWSGCVCPNPIPDDWFLTDEFGIVFWDSVDLADTRIGFAEDSYGRAILLPHVDEDEAYVLVELAAPGFPTVQYDILLSWDEPDALVSIPYEPLPGAPSLSGDEIPARLTERARRHDSAGVTVRRR